jgi:VCBS repeat-containing protein
LEDRLLLTLSITNFANISLANSQVEIGADTTSNPEVSGGAAGTLVAYTPSGNFNTDAPPVYGPANLNNGDVGLANPSNGIYAIPASGSPVTLDFGSTKTITSIAIYNGYCNRDNGSYVLTDASNNLLGAWTISTPDQTQGGTATNHGADSFWLTFNTPVTTNHLLLSATTTETFGPPPHNTPSYREIQVFDNNTPPTVAANAVAVSANEGGSVSNTGTFSDAQGNSTVTITASAGTITQDNVAGTWSWSLNAADGPAGPISVTITANDGVAAPVTTSFDYSVNNLNPDAVDDMLGASEGGSAQVLDLLSNDTDPAGANDPLSITGIDTTGTIGLATLASGQVSYSPNGQFESLGAGETTDDTFTYSISDGDAGTATATVTVTITGQNDAPTAPGSIDDVSVNQNAANTVISLTGLFDDVDANDTLTITAVSSSSGLVTASVSSNLLTLDYQANQNGTATITVTATDGSGASVDLTFNVAVLSPTHLANGIIQLINQWKSDGKINAGVANSMIVKVVNSLKSYDKGNITAAGNQLAALKNEINAKVKPGGLIDADATLAISLIDALYDSMTV